MSSRRGEPLIAGFAGGQTLRERLVLLLSLVLFMAITLWTALHHEAWGDEAYPWMLARDAAFSNMLFCSSNRGIPLLFDLSLMPLARAGLPYSAMQILNLLYVWAAVLLLFRSRAFSSPVKVLFAFSYFPAFEFSVLARPYGLQMLLMFAIAAAWPRRYTNPLIASVWIALLANTTVLGLLTAMVAGVLLLGEWMRARMAGSHSVLVSLLTMIGGGIVSAAQLWPPAGEKGVAVRVSMDTVWYALSNTFFPDARVEMFLVPALIVLGIVTLAISRSLIALALLYLSGSAMMLVYVFVWMGGVRHAGLLLVLILATIWIASSYGPYRRERLLMAALAVSFAWSVYPSTRAWVLETRYAFSGSREVATFLTKSGIAGRATLVAPEAFAAAPLVYLPDVAICHPGKRICRTYSLWLIREFATDLTVERLLEISEKRLQGHRWIYITNSELPPAKSGDYELLFRTTEEIWRKWGERYLVYERR